MTAPGCAADRTPTRVVLVSGLSGAGRSSILRTLEDLGYEAVDNPPLPLLESLVTDQLGRGARRLAIGVDARTGGFDAGTVLAASDRLRQRAGLRPELVYAFAEEGALLRRYTETRRRHPLAPQGRVSDGIAAEIELTGALRAAADLVIDTSDLPLAALRRVVEDRFGRRDGALTVSLTSFAFPAGLPREADMVFDARFLRNPHYDARLKPRTGLDAEVGAYVAADPDYAPFYAQVLGLLRLVLPRFVQEGKKYAAIAVGCTGGRHRSVHIVQQLAADLVQPGARPIGCAGDWTLSVMHRELAREGSVPATPVQAQEA